MSTTTRQHIGAAMRLLWSVSPIVDIARDGWPEKLHVQAIAALQSWRDGDGEDTKERKERQADWVYAIKAACIDSKTLPRERRVLRQSPIVIGGEVVGVETESVDYITAQDVSAWLADQQEAASPLMQLWLNAQGPQTAQPHAAATERERTDFSMLATRKQLIDAFGSFTGMNLDWFNNLKDTPDLLAARRVVGQGGRGRHAEPWFRPFAVMQWLVDPKRKKGRPLSERKGWELLERHFPSVYASRSIGDPREPD